MILLFAGVGGGKCRQGYDSAVFGMFGAVMRSLRRKFRAGQHTLFVIVGFCVSLCAKTYPYAGHLRESWISWILMVDLWSFFYRKSTYKLKIRLLALPVSQVSRTNHGS